MRSLRPSWSRRLRRVCLLLLLGLVTTVGVAWGLAAVINSSSWPGVRRHEWISPTIEELLMTNELHPSMLVRSSFEGLGASRRVWFESSSSVRNTVSFGKNSPDQPHTVHAWSIGGPLAWGRWGEVLARAEAKAGRVGDGLEDARGWPALALWCEITNLTDIRRGTSTSPHFSGGIELPLAASEPVSTRALPLRPIWPGLAFNTVFYALLWWLSFSSVRMARQHRRYRRGVCPVCRYDLRSDYSGGCSECGWGRT